MRDPAAPALPTLGQSAAAGGTRFAAVRNGDVLGAAGSPLWELAGRLARNETIIVADPDVARRFMTVGEAAGLVLEAPAPAEVARLLSSLYAAAGRGDEHTVRTMLRQVII